jgi:hypothetical protein
MNLLERMQNLLCQIGVTSENIADKLTAFIRTGPLGSRLLMLEGNRFLKVFVLIPIFVPEYRRFAMSEALSRANFSLNTGAFEMDWEDGELRFRSAMPVLDAEPTDEQLRCLVVAAWNTAARYMTALVDVTFTDIDPEMALHRAEASWKEEHQQAPVEQ